MLIERDRGYGSGDGPAAMMFLTASLKMAKIPKW
jgi:hypothetical protein